MSKINKVKIAPYWNVNICSWRRSLKIYGVKIAPYWNVNVHVLLLVLAAVALK